MIGFYKNEIDIGMIGWSKSSSSRRRRPSPATTAALLSILVILCDWQQQFASVSGWVAQKRTAAVCRNDRSSNNACWSRRLPATRWIDDDETSDDNKNDNYNNKSYTSIVNIDRRRLIVSSLGVFVTALLALPDPSVAGELGTKITAAVTQSELGQSVRRSVVQGAQVMDQLDSKLESFADRFQLGAERSQRPDRPLPKVIPPAQPLDVAMATQVLTLQDRIFCFEAKIDATALQSRVNAIDQKARPAYERSGLLLSASTGAAAPLSQAADFNYLSYIHYKAYVDLLLDKEDIVTFPSFQKNFDRKLAAELFALTKVKIPTPLSRDKRDLGEERIRALKDARVCIDEVCTLLVEKGFISSFDNANVEAEAVEDWAADLTDLTWSVAIDGDITLQSQMLLQDQGVRLYPRLAHLLVEYVLKTSLVGQAIDVEDYYLDTDYNSDPAKFEVKEVLINVRIESE
jgi:hypothetical protein